MACSASTCYMPEGGLDTEPCVVCGLPTHHICANEVHQDEDLTRRYCSLVCLTKSVTQVNELQTLLDVTKSLTKAIEKDVASEGNVDQSVSKFVKVKKASKPKSNVNLASVAPKKKRTSALNDLRGKYIGKIIQLSGAQLFPKGNDTNTYRLQVVEVHRRRGECGKMVPCVSLACGENPAVSFKDYPVSRFKSFWTTRTPMNKEFYELTLTSKTCKISLIAEKTEGERSLAALKRISMQRKKKRNPRHHARSTSTPTTVMAK